jgi:VCBS repeat-containing protein
MRYEDASQSGLTADNSHTVARPDVDTLPPGSYGPAAGNAVSGSGTTSGTSGADSVGTPPAKVVEVHGAGGATTAASGNFEAAGQFGVLTMDAAGNFTYVRNPGTPDGVQDVFNYTLADAKGASSSTTLTIDIGQVAAAVAGQGVVSLPAGVELSDIHVNGRDLVVDMPDGTQMVIPGGAVFVPQLVIGDVQVPPTNLAALLIDSEPQPAAGPPSSGADWNDPVPPLDPGVPLGDLIPPTELVFTPPEFKEPGFFEGTKPTVVIETPDNPAGVVDASESVDEKGLPTRDGGPAGSGEIADGIGTNNSDPSETNTGTIVFTAPDGLQSVTVDGIAVTAVGQVIAGQFGTMTITSIDLATGQIGYSYTLTTNTSGDATQDLFNVVVTDKDGDAATATLTVHIVDDVPTARNDTDATDNVTHVATGNVMTGADTTSGAAGADTVGADNAQVTAVSGAGGSDSTFADGALVVAGQFGTLTIHGDGSYTYVLNQGAPGGSVDTFNYTLTDGDGDTSTATLTINNPDHTPTVVIETPDNPDGVVAASESVFEKGLPAHDGQPAGSGEIADGNATNNSDPSETNTGTIVFNAQDGLQSITVDGTAITTVGQTIAGQFGTMTITSIDLATGQIGYSYTLTTNTSGDTTADHFSVVVTDSDGDQASATLTVHIVDDVPTAHNDTDLTGLDSHVATGNVITGADTTSGAAGADVVGADNAQLTGISGAGGSDTTADASGNFTVAGEFGTLTINHDGTYTYTESANAPGNSVDTFTYTITDGDGDTSTATLTITNPNHPVIIGENALVQSDDDALANGIPGGIGDGPDAVNLTGTLSGSGGDGQLTWDLQTTGAPAGFSYVDGPNGSVLVQQVQDGQTVTVLTITVDANTGAYSVTQNAPIDHPAGGNENNADFTINYTVTDVDGDSAGGNLNIQVNDDTPVVTLADVATPSLTVDETNLGTDDTKSFASAFTASFGADGPATSNSVTYALGISANGADSGLVDTATGQHIVLVLNSTTGVVEGHVGTTTGALAFTVSVDANGNVTLDQSRAVVHPDGTNPDSNEAVHLASGDLVTLTATATDHDGDTASQSLDLGNQLNFQDDGPTISASTTQPGLTVDETNLGTDASASFAGVFTHSFGADGAGSITYALGISANGAASGLIDTATGQSIVLVLNSTTGAVEGHVGTTGGALAFTVSVDASGTVTLDQVRAVVHPDGTNPDTSEGVSLASDGLVTLTATITDKDGDSATASADIGKNLTFNDDGPTLIHPEPLTTTDQVQAVMTAFLDTDHTVAENFGADGPGSITFANITDGMDSGFKSGGTEITLWLSDNGQTLEGRINSTDGTDGTLIYTVHIDQTNSQYDFSMAGVIDNGSGVSFNDLTSTKAGNISIYGIGAGATGSPDVDAMLSATSSGGTQSTINTDATSIGVGNQSMNPGDSLRIDFVSALNADTANTTTGFDYTSHVETNLFDQKIPQIVGNVQLVSFQVWALQTSDSENSFPDSNPASGFGNSSSVFITEVGLTEPGQQKQTIDVSTLQVGDPAMLIGTTGVSVTRNADGSVTFHNVAVNDVYEVGTGANSFNAVDVQDITGKFDLGIFSLGSTNFGSPVHLNYDLQITDGDGDSVSVPGGVAITLNPAGANSNAVINNTAIHTQDVAHTALSTSSLMPSNDNIEQQQEQRVFNVGQSAALMGALAAAGLDAEHMTLSGHQAPFAFDQSVGMTPLHTNDLGSISAQSVTVAGSPQGVEHLPVMQVTHAAQAGGPIHDMVGSVHPLTTADAATSAPVTGLLHGSGAPGGHATAADASSVTAAGVIMPSAHQLAAATAPNGAPQPQNSVAGQPEHNEVVSKVLADALHGGAAHGPSIDSLLHSLPGHVGLAGGALQAMASHGAALVSIEHMAMATSFGGFHPMLSVEMVTHQDAPPPAHG